MKILKRIITSNWPVIFLFLLTIICFYQITIFGKILWSKLDILLQYFPWKAFYGGKIKQFSLPFWISYMGSGFPIFAGIQQGMLYPPNLLFFFLFSFPFAFNLSFLTHFFLAGFFMYLYCQSIKLSKITSLFSATAFMLSSFLLTHLPHMDLFTTFVWLPLDLFLIEKRFQKNSPIFIILTGLTLGIQILAGSPQTFTFCLLASVSYYIFKFLQDQKTFKIKWIKLGSELSILLLISLSVGMVQILPTLELYKVSIRNSLIREKGFYFTTKGSYSLGSLITFLFPFFYGRDIAGEYWSGNYVGPSSFQETTFYIGILPLIFSLIAVLKKKKSARTTFFIFLAFFSFILSLGEKGLIYLLWQAIPILGSYQIPARFLSLGMFSLIILSGIGFDYLLRLSSQKEKTSFLPSLELILVIFITITCFISLLSIFAPQAINLKKVPNLITFQNGFSFLIILLSLVLVWKKNCLIKKGFVFLVFFLLLTDLFFLRKGYYRFEDYQRLTQKPRTVSFLHNDKNIFRIATLRSEGMKERLKDASLGNLLENSQVFFHISSANIYSLIAPSRYKELFSNLAYEGKTKEDIKVNQKLLNLFNIKYLVTRNNLQADGLSLVFKEGEEKIYQNKNVLPRAFFVKNFKLIKNEGEILKNLLDENFDPEKQVILEEKPEIPDKKLPENSINNNFVVRITNYQDEKVEIFVENKAPGFLVLSDLFFPGWEAFDNKEQTKVYKANYCFRSIFLPSGKHHIKFIYSPTLYFKIGAIISLVTLLSIGVNLSLFFFKSAICAKIKNKDPIYSKRE